MRNLVNNSNWRVDAFDTPAYIQDRALIEVTTHSAIADDTLYLTCGTITATYYVAYENKLVIDVSELVRMNASGTLTLACGNATDLSVAWTRGGLINPTNMIIPRHALEAAAATLGGSALIVPPSAIIESTFPVLLASHVTTTQGPAYSIWDGTTNHQLQADGRTIRFATLAGGKRLSQRIYGAFGSNVYRDGTDEELCGDMAWKRHTDYPFYEEDTNYNILLHGCEAGNFYLQYGNQRKDFTLADGVPQNITFTFFGKEDEQALYICSNRGEDDQFAFEVEIYDEFGTLFTQGHECIFSAQIGIDTQPIPNMIIQNISVTGRQYIEEPLCIVQTQDQCAKRYACVQWVSRSGVTKRAMWEVRKIADTTSESTELERIDNAYDVRKGQKQTMQLVMENLAAYDFWYYSDIVTSSDVRVAFDASGYDATNDTLTDACKVEVTDEKVQQLDGNGGGFSTLAVNINYKRYDTV